MGAGQARSARRVTELTASDRVAEGDPLGPLRSRHALARSRSAFVSAALGWATRLVEARAAASSRGETADVVELRDGGLRLWREERAVELVWADVDDVYGDSADVWAASRASTTEVRGQLWLTTHDGARHLLRPALSDAAQLFGAIIDRCSRALESECRAALEEGDTLTFGPVSLSAEELCVRDKRVALRELARVSTHHDHIVFARVGADRPWASVRYEEVPHVAGLLALLVPTGG